MTTKINNNESQHVYAAEKSAHLDSWLRKIFQNPEKALRRYVSSGMTVIDVGCGTGFFTIAMGDLVGNQGKVIAVDVQSEMLKKMERKLRNNEFKNITLLEGEVTSLSVNNKVDFALAAYVFHELRDQLSALKHLHAILKEGGQVLILEPNFVVSNKSFKKTITYATLAGFKITRFRNTLFSKSILLKKNE